jgi:hypothetical protein
MYMYMLYEPIIWGFIYAGIFISVALLAVILHVILKGDE